MDWEHFRGAEKGKPASGGAAADPKDEREFFGERSLCDLPLQEGRPAEGPGGDAPADPQTSGQAPEDPLQSKG